MTIKFTKDQIMIGELLLEIINVVCLGVAISLKQWGLAIVFIGFWLLFIFLMIFDIEIIGDKQ